MFHLSTPSFPIIQLVAIKPSLHTPRFNSINPSHFDSFKINNHIHTLEINNTNTARYPANQHIMQRNHHSGSTETFQSANSAPNSPLPEHIMQRNHHTGSTESFQTANSAPNSPLPDSPEPERTAQSQWNQNSPTWTTSRSSLRRSMLISNPPSLIRRDGFVNFDYSETDQSSPSWPIPSGPSPRTPSRSGSDFSDFFNTSTVYYQRRPLYSTPPPQKTQQRIYISSEVYFTIFFTAYILIFLPFWFEDIPMAEPLVFTGLGIFLLISYGVLTGRLQDPVEHVWGLRR